MQQLIQLKVNGECYETAVEPRRTLLEVLRDNLYLTGVKEGCDVGSCGACTVLIDGVATLACLTLAVDSQGKEITTVEGLAKNGKLTLLQQNFVDHGAIQCGFCTPGMVLASKSLLDDNPKPTEAEVKLAISGNLCRCTGYKKIVEAVLATAK